MHIFVYIYMDNAKEIFQSNKNTFSNIGNYIRTRVYGEHDDLGFLIIFFLCQEIMFIKPVIMYFHFELVSRAYIKIVHKLPF